MTNSISFSMNGQITLADFASAMQHLSALLTGLAKEETPGAQIDFQIADLRLESETATVVIRPVSSMAIAEEQVIP